MSTMKRFGFSLLAAVTFAGGLFAQSLNGVLVGTVPQVANLTVTQTGAIGTTTWCYWVVAVYTGGKSAPYGPACTTQSNGTLSATNFNTVNFTAPSGTVVAPTGYDILRTTSQTPPTTATQVGGASLPGSVATAQSGSPVNDQSNTTSAYTVSTLTGASITYLDLISNAFPVITTQYVTGTTTVTLPSSQNQLYAVEGSLTDAALATGSVIVAGIAGHTIKLEHALIQPIGGAIATCTNIDFGDSNFANPKFRFLSAGTLSQNVAYSENNASTIVTVGVTTALDAAFGAGLGVGLQSNGGGTCTTATGIKYVAFYRVL